MRLKTLWTAWLLGSAAVIVLPTPGPNIAYYAVIVLTGWLLVRRTFF